MNNYVRAAGALLLAPIYDIIGFAKSLYYFAKSPKDYFYNLKDGIKDQTARRLPWTVNLGRVGTVALTVAALLVLTATIAFPPLAGITVTIPMIVTGTYACAWAGRFVGAAIGGVIDYLKLRHTAKKLLHRDQHDKDEKHYETPLEKKTKNTSTLWIAGSLLKNAVADGLCGEVGLEIALHKKPTVQPVYETDSYNDDVSSTNKESTQYLSDSTVFRLKKSESENEPLRPGANVRGSNAEPLVASNSIRPGRS